MISLAVYALSRVKWQLQRDARSLGYGMLIGVLGAGGQMLLFHAVRAGATYPIFPIISVSPVITIAMAFSLLKERTCELGALGIMLALLAAVLLAIEPEPVPVVPLAARAPGGTR